MRAIILTLIFLLSQTSLLAQQQQLPEWYRVYTFDDSIIEMNTQQVAFSGKEIGRFGRVTFRWSFDQPEPLNGEPQIRYKTRLEVFEFDCADRQRYRPSELKPSLRRVVAVEAGGPRYRPIELTFFDAAGKAIRHEEMNPPGDWRDVSSSDMMARLSVPACELIERRSHPPAAPVKSSEAIEKEKVDKFADSFLRSLEKEKDFTPLVKEFFAPDYINGYLRDKEAGGLLLLNPDVAAKVSHAELQRYHIALLNIGYLSSLYFASQDPSILDEYGESDESKEPVTDEKIVPPGIFKLVENHPYTAAYKGMKNNYDYLAENIDSPERLRLYTDLLEKIAALFRRNLIKISAENSQAYFAAFYDLADSSTDVKVSFCSRDCFGLPKGTKLFEVNVPIFRLQIADINGDLKIVSLTPNFQ